MNQAEVKYRVITEVNITDPPKPHEMQAAQLVANYFKTDVYFQRPEQYKTADLNINGIIWELKNPIGNGKNTIENNLRNAKQQSRRIILDLSRCKLHQLKAKAKIRHFLLHAKGRKLIALLIITKGHRIITIDTKQK